MAALTISRLTMFDGPDWAVSLLGQLYQANTSANLFKRRVKTLSSTPGPSAAYGIDALYAKVSTIAASGTLTIDLNSFTDVASQLTVAMVRLKAVFIMLLSSEEDSTISYTPAGIAVGAAGSNPHPLCFTDAASDKVTLYGGEPFSWWTPTAAGRTVSGTIKNVLITNNDATNAAKVAVLLAGGLT
jgi:hypothetical protein